MKKLLKVIEQIERPGTFCATGRMAPCFPGLEIEGLGAIGLPLSPSQAEEIVMHCSRAPFGRGEKTVVDTDVRRTWELEPDQFSLRNPAWESHLNEVVKGVQESLGVPKGDVLSVLYKLLVYEKGDFFKVHRDSEKASNMFATLVIVLPSQHEGGELIVSHDGHEKRYAFGNEESVYGIQFASFYADCQHEVTPVTDGYRLCLIYNLMLADKKRELSAPTTGGVVAEAAEILQHWDFKEEPEKIAVPFEHHYTQEGLSLHCLKNLDRVMAEVLVEAADRAGCEASLALVTLWESGSADEDYDGYYCNDDDYEMGEVYDSSLTVDHWRNMEGEDRGFGEMIISEEEIIYDDLFSCDEPDEKEVEGPTGNAGVTMDRWYRRAALVLWPKEFHYPVISQTGQKHTIPLLKEMVDQWEGKGAEKERKTWLDSKAFSRAIIDQWRYASFWNAEGKSLSQFFSLLLRLGDVEVLKHFMRQVAAREFSGIEGREITQMCNEHGWKTFQEEIACMLKGDEDKTTAFSQVIRILCSSWKPGKTEQLEVCRDLSLKTLEAVIQLDGKFTEDTRSYGVKKISKSVLVESVFVALCTINETRLLEQFVEHFMNDKGRYGVRPILIPAIRNIHQWMMEVKGSFSSYGKIIEYCIAELKLATATLVTEPADWKQDITLSCKCQYCRELQVFLKDPVEKVYRFRVRKDLRQHLHQEIDKHRCDMTHDTERIGSPHTLVCTKTREFYKKEKQGQERDFQQLAELEGYFSQGSF